MFAMATINYSIKDLEDRGINADRLTKLVESIGMEVEGIKDGEAMMDITPNRPDLLDIVGFGRALLYFSGRAAPKDNFYRISDGPAMEVAVGNAVKSVRPFIAAMIVRDVDLSGNKLKYLINFTEKLSDTYGRRRRKLAMGLHNLDVIKGPLTYDAAHDRKFVPLGKSEKMSFDEIIKNHGKGVEYGGIVTANNPKALYPFLSDSKNILSLIPIINSNLTRVSGSTKNLLVDVTGTSMNAVAGAISMIACSFIDSGAKVQLCEIVYRNKRVKTPELSYTEFRIKKFAVAKTIGAVIEDNQMIALANKMGYTAAKYGSYLLVGVPPYRLDVLNEQDVIEDIAIAYGYDKILPLPVGGFSVGVPEDYRDYFNKVSRLMIGLGFSEAMNTYLTNEGLNFESVAHKHEPEKVVSVAYAKTEVTTMLRTSLLPQLLQNLGQSMHERMPQRLFEIGSAFGVEKGKIKESRLVGIVSEHSKANFAEMKSVIEAVMKHIAAGKYSIESFDDPSFIKGRCARIRTSEYVLGCFGEIAPQVLENFKLEEPVVAAEITMDRIRKA